MAQSASDVAVTTASADGFPAPRSNKTRSPGEMARTAADRCTCRTVAGLKSEVTIGCSRPRGGLGSESSTGFMMAAVPVGRSSR